MAFQKTSAGTIIAEIQQAKHYVAAENQQNHEHLQRKYEALVEKNQQLAAEKQRRSQNTGPATFEELSPSSASHLQQILGTPAGDQILQSPTHPAFSHRQQQNCRTCPSRSFRHVQRDPDTDNHTSAQALLNRVTARLQYNFQQKEKKPQNGTIPGDIAER